MTPSRKSTRVETLAQLPTPPDSSNSSRASSTSGIDPARFYSTPSSRSFTKGVSRPSTRQSLQNPSLKRTRSDSTSTKPSPSKKVRLVVTSALDKAFSAQKEEREYASKRWLYHHRHLFEPLFAGEKSNFFEQLKDEAKGWKKTDQAFNPMHEIEEQPKLLKHGQLKDYQLHGISFLAYMYRNGMNCILGDEMGLGKTLQTLSLFATIREICPESAAIPHLVICPLSVLSSWENECKQWFPSFRILRYHGPVSERERIKATVLAEKPNFDICLTTYDQFVVDDGWFKSRRWHHCVLDEGHKVKNAKTQVSKALAGLGCLYRLILTGTPLQNNLSELWALLHWLYPSIFRESSERKFISSFNMEQGTYDMGFLNAAHNLLEQVMLRRTKSTVVVDIPPKEELTVFLPLSEAQRFWTYRMLTKVDSVALNLIFNKDEAEEPDVKIELDDADNTAAGRKAVLDHIQQQATRKKDTASSGDKWKKLMNLLMQLRKICDHPYLLPNAEPEPYRIGEHIVASSAKLMAIDKILADVLPRGERVLIFSQWRGMLDILEDYLELRSYRYARLDGSTPRPRRTLDIKLFQQDNSPYQVFLILTKAGGLGINLTKATHVIMCDTDWNPQNDIQAIARAHRIGQKKTVKVYRLICRATVEDQMLDRLRRKLFLSVKIMGNPSSSNNGGGSSTGLGSNELMSILRNGSSALTRTDDGMSWSEFLKAPISQILELSRKKLNARDAKLRKQLGSNAALKQDPDDDEDSLLRDAENEEQKLLSGVARVRCNIFEGEVINRKALTSGSNQDIAREWKDMQQQAKHNKNVVVGGMSFDLDSEPSAESGVPVGPSQPLQPVKNSKRSTKSEDWCIYCRDGGELVLCPFCPRVYHADCAGLTAREVKKPSLSCAQHSCSSCQRTTTQCGNMLFRCQTCPDAFCEDCLPFDDIFPVGDTLPEFELLGYGAKSSAYYIRCADCLKLFKEEPKIWKEWQEEMKETQAKLDSLYKISC